MAVEEVNAATLVVTGSKAVLAVGRIDGIILGRAIDDFSDWIENAVEHEHCCRWVSKVGYLWHLRIAHRAGISAVTLPLQINVHIVAEKAVRAVSSQNIGHRAQGHSG